MCCLHVQMLSYLRVAMNVTGQLTGIYRDAFNELCNATNQYHINVVSAALYACPCHSGFVTGTLSSQINAKIESPLDDNYSDDELAFLPYFAFFTALQDEQVCHACALVCGAVSTASLCFVAPRCGPLSLDSGASSVQCGQSDQQRGPPCTWLSPVGPCRAACRALV